MTTVAATRITFLEGVRGVAASLVVVQHLLARNLQKPPSIPSVSRSFNWYSWFLGMVIGSFVGGALAGAVYWLIAGSRPPWAGRPSKCSKVFPRSSRRSSTV